MLCVKTTLKDSSISGIGLFADEFIPKDAVVWKFNPYLDVLLSNDQIDNLSFIAQKQVYNYAYLDKTHNKYLLCGDDARFFNHSLKNNCDDSLPDITIAKLDIFPGEELTVNYKEFYGDLGKHPEIK